MSNIGLHSERLFKKPLTVDQVRESYKPCISRKWTYPSNLRCKVNIGGSSAVRCWSALDQRVAIPDDLRGYELLPRVHISHLWIMNRECGFVVKVLICKPLRLAPHVPLWKNEARQSALDLRRIHK